MKLINVFMLAWSRPRRSDWYFGSTHSGWREGPERNKTAGLQAASSRVLLEGAEKHPGQLLHSVRRIQQPIRSRKAENDLPGHLCSGRMASTAERCVQRIHLLL